MLTQFSNHVADAVDAAAPSVVQVSGRRRPASGIVYAAGTVLTTMRALGSEDGVHVRAAADEAREAELVSWDPATGLALLRAPGLTAPPLTLAEQPARIGHVTLAVARSWSNAVTASTGIIATIGGPLRTGRRRSIDQIFRTTAPMHDGFAGGAVLNTEGRLIGIATATAIRGLAVVVPGPIAWKTAATALEHGRVKRGYLGIGSQSAALTPRQRDVAGQERGVVVLAVTEGAPADAAGVLVGDVLLSANTASIESVEDLSDLLLRIGAGQELRLRVLRGRDALDVTVRAGERPGR